MSDDGWDDNWGVDEHNGAAAPAVATEKLDDIPVFHQRSISVSSSEPATPLKSGKVGLEMRLHMNPCLKGVP